MRCPHRRSDFGEGKTNFTKKEEKKKGTWPRNLFDNKLKNLMKLFDIYLIYKKITETNEGHYSTDRRLCTVAFPRGIYRRIQSLFHAFNIIKLFSSSFPFMDIWNRRNNNSLWGRWNVRNFKFFFLINCHRKYLGSLKQVATLPTVNFLNKFSRKLRDSEKCEFWIFFRRRSLIGVSSKN